MQRMIVVLAVVAGLGPSAQADVRITVYNSDLALVKDTRTLEYERGVFDLSFTDVAAAIDPTSVVFTVVGNPDAVTLLEQNYRYDLVSSEKILEKYIDRTIRVITKQEKVHEGVLLAADNRALTLQNGDGGLTIVSRAEVADLSFPALPEGLITRPTLVWKLDSDLSGPVPSEVRYLTGKVSWHAEYIATLNAAEDGLELAGWVSIDNRSGATYTDAQIKLVAGDVHRVQEKHRPMMEARMAARSADVGFAEKSFFEYHLYTLERPSTLRDNEIKQLALFETATVKAEKVFTFDGGRYGDKVRVTMEFVNSAAAGLGFPLPKGKIRAMKADSDGSLEFIGEDLIDHTPRDEEVRILMGHAFDIVGERKPVDRRQLSKRVYQETFEIEIRNHKDVAVSVVVVEHFWGDWTITESSLPFTKEDAGTAEWRLDVPADGELMLRYTVERRT